MPTCRGCKTDQTPDSYLVCPADSTPSAPFRPYALYVHTRPDGLTQWTEIRPAGGARPLAQRERRRPGTRHVARVPVCPKCDGELLRR